MRLGDLCVASRLCSMWHLDASTHPEAFLQTLHTWWVGLESSPYIVCCSFMETYTRQFNLSNHVFHASTATGSFKRNKSFIPPCGVLVPQRLRSVCRTLMIRAVFLSRANG